MNLHVPQSILAVEELRGLMLGSHHLIGAKANRPVLGAWSRAGRGNRRLEDDGAGDAHPPQGLVDTRGRCSDESDWDAHRRVYEQYSTLPLKMKYCCSDESEYST